MSDLSSRMLDLSPQQRDLLLRRLGKAHKEKGGVARTQILRQSRQSNRFPLSFAQEPLWTHDCVRPGTSEYNVPQPVRIRSPLDLAALHQSLNEVVRRQDSLRTTFATVEGQPVQIIAPAMTIALPLIDLQALPEHERAAETHRLVNSEARHPFDLAHGPLLRATLLRLSPDEHLLMLTMHHIICDGWSVGVLVREIAAQYESLTTGKPALPELPIQYADFAVWQREWLRGPVLDAQLAFWREYLAGAPPVLELPTDRPRPAVLGRRGERHALTIARPLMEALRALSQREGATLFMTILAAFKVLLHYYTGQVDIVVGSPIAGRSRAEIEGLIGFFSNNLVLRGDLSGNPTFRELLGRVHKATIGAFAHQEMPFNPLVEALEPERNPSYTPLFQVMFILEIAPLPVVTLTNLSLCPQRVYGQTAACDLTLSFEEWPDELRGWLEYNTDLFDTATIVRMAGHFQTLLAGIAANPDQRLAGLPFLTAAERRQVLADWNATTTSDPLEQCIHELFAAQAARTPDAPALRFGREQLTYRELDQRANQLAHELQGLGVGPEVRVGICMERSPALVVGLLGILKAGGAYVPLDPTYPAERLAFMLEDSQASVLITHQEPRTKPALSGSEGNQEPEASDNGFSVGYPLGGSRFSEHVIDLDRDWPTIARQPTTCPASGVTSEHLAYVIYTSGSTGRPKGVAIEHRSTIALLYWARTLFSAEDLAGVLASTSICFDLSVFELFVPLSWGGTVILAENALQLPSLPQAARVTLINTVPSAISELLRIDGIPDTVRVVNLAGEPLQNKVVQQLYGRGTIERVFNLYGPTEDTTYSTFALVERGAGAPPPIGRPIANTQIYLLDAQLRPVPVGVPGELYLGGAGLARGYLNRPDLTAERFISNPFTTTDDRRPLRLRSGQATTDDPFDLAQGRRQPTTENQELIETDSPAHPLTRSPAQDGGEWSVVSGRLYKTGDLARYREDGTIEYLGRLDHQVKLRGFRIELGEIEAALLQHPALREVIVLVRNPDPSIPFAPTQGGRQDSEGKGEDAPGGKQLVAYIVPSEEPRTKNQEPISQAEGSRFSVLSSVELRAFLKQRLPDYMIPTAFVVLDALPLTPNGKVDRKALPAPDVTRPELQAQYVAPRTPIEQALVAIWAEVLGLEQIGIYDNFFELGGYSLQAVQVVSRVRDAYQIDLPPLDSLLTFPTIADLAEAITRHRLEQTDTVTLDQLFAEIGELSEDEVQTMLSTEMLANRLDYSISQEG